MNCLGEFGVAERQPSKVNVEGRIPRIAIRGRRLVIGAAGEMRLRFQSMARSALIGKALGSAQNRPGHCSQQKPTT